MNPPSQPAPQTRAFQSWQLVFIAVMLLAATVTSGLYIATVQAESHGAITGLTLTSDAPGTLAVSWESASPTPTDYRVDWAQSDEDYQSWKVDDGHKYPAPTATTVTIADLEHDTEYKIRMRARYYRGEHEGKSWGGPWATATITVAGEPAETPTPEPTEEEPAKEEPVKRPPKDDPPRDDPAPEDTTPAAPSFINTAVTEGQVLLSWSNPSDDSITGYQILRGPDTDSLAVIEDDTGSSLTSYTDTAPPAGQTHTYGVKARNASGLGPVGTATAAVPEVLIVARHESSDGTLVSNLGQTSLNSGSVVGTDSGINTEFAIPFTTGANPFGYHVKDVQAYLSRPDTSNFPNPRITIRRDNAGLPGETMLYTFDTSSTTIINTTPHLFEFPTEKESTLKPNIRYWLYVANEGSTAMSIQNTASDDEDTQSQPNWQIGNTWYTKEDGGTWTPSTDNNLRIKISGHAIQQKEVIKLGGNKSHRGSTPIKIGFAGAVNLISTARIGYATSFTPGDDAGWYALSSINFQIRTRLKNLIRVAVHRDDGGAPAADSLYVAYTEVQTGPFQRHELAARFQDNATLDGGSTYWAVFDEMTGMAHYTKDTAKNGNEDAGFESWAIGDTGYKINYLTATGFTWTPTTTGPLLMTFHGYAEPERTLVGAHGLRDTADDGPLLRFGTERITKAWLKLPMGQTFDFCEPTFVAGSGTERSWRRCDLSPSSHHDHEWAGGRGFTTGPNPTGYTISGLGVDMDVEERTINPIAAIHSTSAFQTAEGSLDPQSPLANYQAQADIAGSPNSFAPRTGSEEVHLSPNTTYVAYFENDATGYFETPNARAGQDAEAEDGWTLGYPYGSKFIHPLGFAGEPWNLGDGESKRIPLNIYGWPNPLVAAPNPEPPAPAPALVSNLDLTPGDRFILQRSEFLARAIASPFTTGSHGAGYALHGLQIELQNQPVEFVGGIKAAIHNDNDGEPGAFLHELGLQVNLQKGIATFHAPASTILAANTTYWLILRAESMLTNTQQVVVVLAHWKKTSSNVRNGCDARNWSIGTSYYWRATSAHSWNGSPDSIKMAILGERVSDPSVESSEPTCDDLPESTTTTGRLIVDGDGVKGQHHTQGDADWYSIDLLADTYYQFTANPGKKGLPHYILRIFDDAGVELRNSLITPVPSDTQPYYDAPDRLNSLPFRTDTAGTFYVSIEPSGANDPDTVYTLIGFDDDYSDDIAGTGIVDVGKSFQNYVMRTDVNPDSSVTSDVDWIRVALEAGATYEIVYDVACLHEGEIVGIHDPHGMMIPDTEKTLDRQTDGYCTNLTTEFISPSNDDYYIAVSAKGSTFPSGTANPFTGVHGTLSIKMTNPPSTAATGDPLVRGERKVSATLTGNTKGIADPNGLTNPVFNYQWQRMENGTPEDIPGAASETYTLTDDDVGKRVQLQVRFNDDEGAAEMRTGPATSIIIPNPRILVTNASRSSNTATTDDYSSAFITGPHPLGYTIDTITMPRSNLTPAPSTQGEYRLYSSVGTSNPIFAYPNDLLMTASPPDEANDLVLAFSAPSRVKLRPNTPYQNVLTSKTSQAMGCNLSDQGVDGISLAGFSIPARSHQFGNPLEAISKACLFKIWGFELTTSSFVKKVEFTSTPTSEGMYATGGTIEVTAELTETVTFTEPPLMLLQVGDNEREMTYVASRSTGTSWVFQHTVTANDRDDDGVSLEHNALRGYADADLSHRSITNDRGHHVNAVPQIVSRRVSSKPLVPNWYGTTEQIEFTLEFSLPVKVVGFPQLEFNVNTPAPDNEFALFNRGSGTKELVFSYTVGTDDDDPDGISWNENSLRLDTDASITSTFNNLDANLDHTELGKLESHRIDQNPRAISQEVTSEPTDGTNSDTYGAGDMITFQVVFNQVVIVNGVPRLRFSIGSGADDEYATYVSGTTGNTVTFSYTVLTADADTDGIYLYTDPLDYPDPADDSILSIYNDLPAENSEIGKEGTLSDHKVDGSITN